MPFVFQRETDGGFMPPHSLATAQVPPRASMISELVLFMQTILAAANHKSKPQLTFVLLGWST